MAARSILGAPPEQVKRNFRGFDVCGADASVSQAARLRSLRGDPGRDTGRKPRRAKGAHRWRIACRPGGSPSAACTPPTASRSDTGLAPKSSTKLPKSTLAPNSLDDLPLETDRHELPRPLSLFPLHASRLARSGPLARRGADSRRPAIFARPWRADPLRGLPGVRPLFVRREGRARQLSALPRHLSALPRQLSALPRQLSALPRQLSALPRQLSALAFRLSALVAPRVAGNDGPAIRRRPIHAPS